MAQSFDPLNQPLSPNNKNKNNKSSSVLAIILLLILLSGGILLFLIFKDPNNPITTSIKTTNTTNIFSSNSSISSDNFLLSSQKALINANSSINSTLSSTSIVTSSVVNKLGSISGYLIYPSDFIPGQNVCAKEQRTNQEFCVSTTDGQETYKINNLPQGSYKVYVQSLNTNNLNKKPLENLVYYNQYVVDCMMKDYDTPSCLGEAVPSSYHTNIYSVEIKDGNNLENINPWDWYSTSSASKQTPNPVILPNG